MQLSLHADYALRVLIYLGAHPGRKVTTRAISDAYGISKNHLVRVVQTLAHHGYVSVTPGRTGGVALAQPAQSIRLGEVVRHAEPQMRLVECFDPETNSCPIAPACRLKATLRSGLESFLARLNEDTLADLLAEGSSERLEGLFVQISRASSSAP